MAIVVDLLDIWLYIDEVATRTFDLLPELINDGTTNIFTVGSQFSGFVYSI